MKSPSTPAVTVVMSVYNGEEYVGEAIQSVLKQTFRDFEFIVINDGSTDETAQIIGRFDDPRIRLVNQANQGLVASLNTGIKLARGALIARQDADDVSRPERLERQMAFMVSNADYVVVGCNLIFIDDEGRPVLESPLLLDDGELRLEMLIRSPFGHGSVMYRAEAVRRAGGYRQKYWPAEDYDLWRRLLAEGKFANINEVLYLYRVNDEGISSQNSRQQTTQADRVRNAMWAAVDKSPVRFRSAYVHYPSGSSYTRLQLGRLTVVYVEVMAEALRRHSYGYCLRVATALMGNTKGAYFFSRYLARRLLKR
jgi:glycosyltransferase involved in cell wall biosynthesis